MSKSLLLTTALLISGAAHAADRAPACVKYETEDGWSKSYAVDATILTGSELNHKVGSLTRFNSFATYAVIFWDKNEVTIIKLPGLYMGSLPIFEKEVEDQLGRRWRIKEGHDFCH